MCISGRNYIVSCKHVVLEDTPGQLRGFGYHMFAADVMLRHVGIWDVPRDPVDIAVVEMDRWYKVNHRAKTIESTLLAENHNPVEGELLFLIGFAGENALSFGNTFQPMHTSFCTQEIPGSRSSGFFDMHWDAENSSFTEDASPEMKRDLKHNNPAGLSGALVWNTRFVEIEANGGGRWSAADAQVTGILARHHAARKAISGITIEKFRDWLVAR